MTISIVAAVAKNNVIGKNNELLWHLGADMKRFKNLTNGKMVIMGRKTHESIGKVLPNRVNVVLSFDKNYTSKDCIVMHDLNEALRFANDNKLEEVFIIGGGSIYEQAMDLVDKMYLTVVDVTPEGDAHFPAYNIEDWDVEYQVFVPKDDNNDYDSTYYELEM
jgi:dihydrofolate reductase